MPKPALQGHGESGPERDSPVTLSLFTFFLPLCTFREFLFPFIRVHSPSRIAQSLKDYNEAIRLNPKLAIAYNNRGAVAQHRKQSESALVDYDRAIVAARGKRVSQ